MISKHVFSGVALMALVLATASPAFALVAQTPEIDASTMSVGLGGLAGGVLLLRALRRK